MSLEKILYGAQTEPEEDYSQIPISAVSPESQWVAGEEQGIDLQGGAAASLSDQFLSGPYEVPQQVHPGSSPYKAPFKPTYSSQKPPDWKQDAIRQGATMAVQQGIRHGIASYGASQAGHGTVTVGVNQAGQGTYQSNTVGMYGGQGGGLNSSNLMSAYAGYKASPYGASFEREHWGGYSPGYAGSGSATPMFQAMGGRTDKEAKQARGERIGMSGAGAIAGGMGGGGWGAVYGAGGAQFQENPYSGKRGYQEEYKYTFKPIGQSIGREMKETYGTKSGWKKIAYTGGAAGVIPMSGKKGTWSANVTNLSNWKDSARSAIPGMAGLGGGGKLPPAESEVRRDINYMLSKNVMTDYQINEWWNTVASQGVEAGREYIKGGLAEEGRAWGTDENLPEWVTGEKTFGKGDHVYQYGPEEVAGQRVASKYNVGTLAALQSKLETGSRRDFWENYMKDYNMFQKGGAGYQKMWKGKQLYNLPSEVYGLSPQEAFKDIDFGGDYTDIDWLRQVEEDDV